MFFISFILAKHFSKLLNRTTTLVTLKDIRNFSWTSKSNCLPFLCSLTINAKRRINSLHWSQLGLWVGLEYGVDSVHVCVVEDVVSLLFWKLCIKLKAIQQSVAFDFNSQREVYHHTNHRLIFLTKCSFQNIKRWLVWWYTSLCELKSNATDCWIALSLIHNFQKSNETTSSTTQTWTESTPYSRPTQSPNWLQCKLFIRRFALIARLHRKGKQFDFDVQEKFRMSFNVTSVVVLFNSLIHFWFVFKFSVQLLKLSNICWTSISK